MSRASKNVYHPHGNANTFATVEETLDGLDIRVTATESDVSDLAADIATINGTIATKAAKAQSWEQSWIIEYPQNKDYRVVINATLARTITKVTTRSSTGTCTLTAKINTTALGGSANSVSTSEVTQNHSSSNSVAVGDDIVFTISSLSGAENLAVTIAGTITLA